jgi:fimbrial chaperone protein
MGSNVSRFLGAALLIGSYSAGLSAFTLQPMSVLLAPSGTGSIATFRIKNDGSERLAVRFSVLTRSIAPDGKEQNESADQLFLIYPARVLVEPGAFASVKVQWRGPSVIDAEHCFRFVADQVNLDAAPQTDGKAGIKVRFRYVASLYIGTAAFVPSLTASVTGGIGPNGEKGYIVEVANQGRRHVVAIDLRIDLGGDESPLSSAELGELSGTNYLPGTDRKSFIPRPEAVLGESYEAKVEYESSF